MLNTLLQEQLNVIAEKMISASKDQRQKLMAKFNQIESLQKLARFENVKLVSNVIVHYRGTELVQTLPISYVLVD